MPEADGLTAPMIFGADAVQFVLEELRTAAEPGWDGQLAARLAGLEFDAPFSFLTKVPRPGPHSFRSGGVHGGPSDRQLAEVISTWLSEPDDLQRALVHEELLIPCREAGCHDDEMYVGDRVYFVARAGADAEKVMQIWKWLYGYPGIGVLTKLPPSADASYELTAADLDAISEATVAVLARAWDDEAFLLAPVTGRFELPTVHPGSSSA